MDVSFVSAEAEGPSHRFTKKKAPKNKVAPNEIYVSRRSRQKHLQQRADSLLHKGETVVIYGLGAAVKTAVEMGLELRKRWDGKVTLDCHTDTVELLDEYVPLKEDQEPKTGLRLNSSIKITVKKRL